MKKYTLIIVDDEQEVLAGLLSVVNWERLGFSVIESMTDGQQVIEYFKANQAVDVVLVDYKMQNISGIEVAGYLYDNHPETRVVLLSGYSEFAVAKQAIEYNVYHYLLKPTDLDELHAVFTDLYSELLAKDIAWQYETLLTSGLDTVTEKELLSLVGIEQDLLLIRQNVIAVALKIREWYQQQGQPIGETLLSDELYDNVLKSNSSQAILDFYRSFVLEFLFLREDAGSAQLRQIRQYVRHHLEQPIHLSHVAEHLQLNPSYISRMFRQETGQGFSDYVVEQKMDYAAHLALTTTLKVYEISEKVGFKDIQHFYKQFKAHTGKTPTEYRKEELS